MGIRRVSSDCSSDTWSECSMLSQTAIECLRERDLRGLDRQLAFHERKLHFHKRGSCQHTKYKQKLELLEYVSGLRPHDTCDSVISLKHQRLAHKYRTRSSAQSV